MADIKIAAIMRSTAYSPNHIGNDAAILNAVTDQLRKRGIEVRVYSEEQFIVSNVAEPIVISMCRDPRSIAMLQKAEDAGKLVINSAYGVENCTRDRLTRIMMGSSMPYPASIIVDTDESVRERLRAAGFSQCWVKRGDTHAMHKEDVSYVRHADEAQEVVQEYFMRGIPRAVISKHVQGDLIKFYGVLDSPFFYWFCPAVVNGGRYCCERLNDPGASELLDAKLKELCRMAAEELNVRIYGGDCIVDADGHLTFVSFNDWPSFAPCRAEAAAHIAKSVLASVKKNRR